MAIRGQLFGCGGKRANSKRRKFRISTCLLHSDWIEGKTGGNVKQKWAKEEILTTLFWAWLLANKPSTIIPASGPKCIFRLIYGKNFSKRQSGT
jgi:hypothetical protein